VLGKLDRDCADAARSAMDQKLLAFAHLEFFIDDFKSADRREGNGRRFHQPQAVGHFRQGAGRCPGELGECPSSAPQQ